MGEPAGRIDEVVLRKIRGKIVQGLVRLAGAEPVRAGKGQSNLPEPTEAQRRDAIEKALTDLKANLVELSRAIDQSRSQFLEAIVNFRPEKSTNDSDLEKLMQTTRRAMETVATLRAMIPPEDVTRSEPQKLKDFLDEVRLKAFVEQARQPISELINEWFPVQKIFVAVHGIGDQFLNETVQSVAVRVCDYVGVPAALPLGRFHGGGATVTGAFLPDPDRDPPVNCAFAEIYWADVPRGPASDEHTLEEPKKWARTLVERLRLKAPNDPLPIDSKWRRAVSKFLKRSATNPAADAEEARRNDRRLEQLLEELIQGVIVADRLVFLADKAGLFKFNLKKLLNDYLNDVQVVTEFEDFRKRLLDIFDEVLEKIHRYFYRSEIYIVAHSEGTVVSFMGLLRGISERENRKLTAAAHWSGMIRGLMTIGSPLNKHVRFWPELFDQFKLSEIPSNPAKIVWKNYYDYGDPIGYDLKPTRAWMVHTGWDRFFEFSNPRDKDPKAKDSGDDIGFTRYYFPGEAHNEYWRDPGVFGHFIEDVVDPIQNRTPTFLKPKKGPHGVTAKPYGVPATRLLARLTSYPMPYFLSAVLLFVACYILYKAVRGCLDPIAARFDSSPQVFMNVLGLSGLIAGMSLLAQIPRLAKGMGWRVLALILALVFSSGYFLLESANRTSIERIFTAAVEDGPVFNKLNTPLVIALAVGVLLLFAVKDLRPVLFTLLPVVFWVLVLRIANGFLSGDESQSPDPSRWHGWALISVALLIALMAWQVSTWYPEVGTKPLVHTGGLVVLLVVSVQFAFSSVSVDRSARETLAKTYEDKIQGVLGRVVESSREKMAKAPGESSPSTPEAEKLLTDAASLKIVSEAALEQGAIWPVYLAGVASLYLWWLAILLFNLTFVWHLYIRWGGASKYIEQRSEAEALRRKNSEGQLSHP